MKRNVDLTSNEMFASKRVSGISRVAQLGRAESGFRISNRIDPFHDDAVDDLVLTGNRDTRSNKKFYRSMDLGDSCDCCGASLINIPWKRRYGLCRQCEVELESQNPKQKPSPFDIDQRMRGNRRRLREIF